MVGTGPPCAPLSRERREMKNYHQALAAFKTAAVDLSAAMELEGRSNIPGYPSYLPSLDQFVEDVQTMGYWRALEDLDVPPLPPVGTIVWAKHDIDPMGSFTWKEGWAGRIVDVSDESVSVERYSYLGPSAHQWNNCRVLTIDDGHHAYFLAQGCPDRVKFIAPREWLALALHQEFR